jgi:hypothetical protein
MRKRIASVLLAMVLMIGLIQACSLKSAYVTLNTSQSAYMTGMQAVADLQGKGLISVEQRTKINDVARIFKNTHNIAVDAMAVWYKTGLPSDKSKFEIAFLEAATKWADLAILVNSFKSGTLPEQLKK